jgi:protein TonB
MNNQLTNYFYTTVIRTFGKTIAMALFRLLLLSCSLLFISVISAQEEAGKTDPIEQAPEFPGGMTAMYEYLAENMHYPLEARAKGIEGKVYVQFVISKTGDIEDVEIIKGVHDLIDKQAFIVVRDMPDWTPGKHEGKPVRVRYTIPINFTLSKQDVKDAKKELKNSKKK